MLGSILNCGAEKLGYLFSCWVRERQTEKLDCDELAEILGYLICRKNWAICDAGFESRTERLKNWAIC